MHDFQKCQLLFCHSNQPEDEQLQENISYQYNNQHKKIASSINNQHQHQMHHQHEVFSFKLQQFRNYQQSDKTAQKSINTPPACVQVNRQTQYIVSNRQAEKMFSPVRRVHLSPSMTASRSPTSRTMISPNNKHKIIEEKTVFTKVTTNRISNPPPITFPSPNSSMISIPVSVFHKASSQQTNYSSKDSQQNAIYRSNVIVEEQSHPHFVQLQCLKRNDSRKATKELTEATDSHESSQNSQLIYQVSDNHPNKGQAEQNYTQKLTKQLFPKARQIQTRVNLADYKEDTKKYISVGITSQKEVKKSNVSHKTNQSKKKDLNNNGEAFLGQNGEIGLSNSQRTLIDCSQPQFQPINSQVSSSSSIHSSQQNMHFAFFQDQLPKNNNLFIKNKRVAPIEQGDNYKSKNIQSHLFQIGNIVHNTTLKQIIDKQHNNQRKVIFDQTSPTNSMAQIHEHYVPGMFKHPKTILSIGSYPSENSCLDIKFMQSLGSKRGVHRLV